MRANELRIGNWVNSQFGGIQQVVDVMCDGVNTLKYDGINYEFIDPIPLTEEWLLKFGFEYNDYYKNYKIKADIYYHSVKLDDGVWCYNNDYSDAGCYFISEIEYVHQLQNLYFALTQTELVYEKTV